jgi:hypothetical protein
VLAVIQDQQETTCTQVLRERGLERLAGSLRDPERPGHRLDDQTVLRHGGQFDQGNAIDARVGLSARDFQS